MLTSLSCVCFPRCESFDNGQSLLSADFRIDCNSPRYHTMVIVSLIITVVFPIGVPLVLGLTLWWKRHALHPRNKGFVLAVAFPEQTTPLQPVTVVVVHTERMLPTLGPELQDRVRWGKAACQQGLLL